MYSLADDLLAKQDIKMAKVKHIRDLFDNITEFASPLCKGVDKKYYLPVRMD